MTLKRLSACFDAIHRDDASKALNILTPEE